MSTHPSTTRRLTTTALAAGVVTALACGGAAQAAGEVTPAQGPTAGGNEITVAIDPYPTITDFDASSGPSSVALLSDGSVYAWTHAGYFSGDYPGLGQPAKIDTSAVGTHKIVQVQAGTWNFLALSDEGKVYSWGAKSSTLGDGDPDTAVRNPTSISDSGPLAGKKVVKIDSENNQAAAITDDGKLYVWGTSMLGDNNNGGSSVPVLVGGELTGKQIVSVTSARRSTSYGIRYAIDSDGVLYGWGEGPVGTADSQTVYQFTPAKVGGELTGKKVTAVWAGYKAMFATTADGGLYSWGSNDHLNLGNGSTTTTLQVNQPVKINATGPLAGKNVVQMNANAYTTTALTSDGKVYSWGTATLSNTLGLDSVTSTATPMAVDLSALGGRVITQLTGDGVAPVLRTADDHLYGWGAYGTVGAASPAKKVPTLAYEPVPFLQVDGVNATDVSYVSTTAVRGTVSAHASGKVDVVAGTNFWGSVFAKQSNTYTKGYQYGSAPVVTLDPTSVTLTKDELTDGQQVTFETAGTGDEEPTIQWQESTDGTTWADLAGATTTTLDVAALPALSGHQFRAVFTNPLGSATSQPATLTITEKGSVTPPTVDPSTPGTTTPAPATEQGNRLAFTGASVAGLSALALALTGAGIFLIRRRNAAA